MKNNYNAIAPYYDVLSRLVFFRAQLNAQIRQLVFIPPDSQVLIVGGGTGWILEEIAKVHSGGLSITYVEISEKMLELSRKRNVKGNSVTFVQAAAEDFKTQIRYDVVLTAFLFDNFNVEKIGHVFNELNHLLRPGGYWLFCDFYNEKGTGKNWKWYLLKMMYLFFNRISHLEAKSLINTENYFSAQNYKTLRIDYHYNGFIKAITYQKP
jgi:ubiquinone/menaquinone biosynthesis C-methylase UbiE